MRFPPTGRLAAVAATVLLGAASVGAALPSGAGAANHHRGSVSLRLGYLPNLTHAADLVGISGGCFNHDVPAGTSIATTAFNAGPDAVTALLANQLDAAFIGPSPAISAFQVSHGQFVVVAGAASGGAAFVVQPGITKASQLKGKTVSSPQLGNTQDVSLRFWLKSKGLRTTVTGGGDVSIAPQANSQIVTAFQAKAIAGAWVPEPYVATLVADGGHVLVNEASLWPKGNFATTVLVVNKSYLKAHPAVIKGLLKGELDAINHINANKVSAEAEINAAIKAVTGKTLKPAIMHAALADVSVTWDPIASSIAKDASNAYKLNFLTSANVRGIFNVTLLNQLLKAAHKPLVIAP